MEYSTELEQKVIDILVGAGVTSNAWAGPIHAVDLAMGWSTDQTIKFVYDLMEKSLVEPIIFGRDGAVYQSPKWEWRALEVLSVAKSKLA